MNVIMINGLVELLNKNQGAAIAVLTLALVLVTIVYAIASVKLVKQMKESNDLVRESNDLSRQAIIQSLGFEKQRNRPYVIFDLVAKNRCFYATVKNIGKHPAYDVKINMEPEILRDIKKYEKISFTQHEIPFLAPDREIEDLVDTTPDFLKKYPEAIFSVNLSYKDSRGELYKETSNISAGFHMNRMTASMDDPVKKIGTYMDRMVRILQEIQKAQQQMMWIQNRITESLISKRELIEENRVNLKEPELTKDEIDYIIKIAEQGGKIYCTLLSTRSGKVKEIYRDMLNKFAQVGLMREEINYWTLTAKGYDVCEQLRQINRPKNDKIDTSNTND